MRREIITWNQVDQLVDHLIPNWTRSLTLCS